MTILPLPRPEPEAPTSRPSAAKTPEVRGQEFDEVEVMRRLQSGDTAALQQIMDLFWNPLTAFSLQFLNDRDDAADVTQSAFVRLWNHRGDWKPGSLRSYLFRLTRNIALDKLRAEKARSARQQASTPPAPRTPAEVLECDEMIGEVDRAVQALSPRRREVFTLAYLHGLSYRQIAEIMEISENTVSNQMTKALAELRTILQPLVGTGPKGVESPALDRPSQKRK